MTSPPLPSMCFGTGGCAVRINDAAVDDEKRLITGADLNADGVVKLSLGRKKHMLVRAA